MMKALDFSISMRYYGLVMSKYETNFGVNEMRITSAAFLVSYNENMPESFPRASLALLRKFKDEHPMLFKRDNLWSLDQHRKKLMDWLPRNTEPL